MREIVTEKYLNFMLIHFSEEQSLMQKKKVGKLRRNNCKTLFLL